MTIARKAILPLLCLSLLVPATAFAQEDTVPQGEQASTTAEGDEDTAPKLLYRLWGDLADNPTFAAGDGERTALRQLIRGRIDMDNEEFRMVAEVDLFAGRLAGDSDPAVPEDAQSGTQASRDLLSSGRLIDPREFYAQWLTPVGQLRGGLQTSQWGLGILANGGSTQTESLFNQHFGGDRVIRAVFATAPLRPLSEKSFLKDVYVAVGGDYVWRDENADLLAGDQALQGMSAILYDTEQTKGGTYVVYRNQTDRDDDFLEIWAFDVYGDHTMSVADDFEIRAAAEAAFLTGTSNRSLTQDGQPVSVTGLGAAAELGVHYEPAKLGLELRSGYASGDANTDDDTLYRFRFDPNYNVGLVMFDYYLPAVTRTSVSAIHDPARSGEAPKGVGGLVNDGGIENALYLSPRVLYGSEDGFLAGFSFLWAQADQPVFDPYNSFENGGVPTGINGRSPASKDLGMEFDAAMQYRFEPVDELTLEMKGEYGIFFPGEAFEDASGAPQGAQSLARVRMSVLW
jgi:hypothetical protein